MHGSLPAALRRGRSLWSPSFSVSRREAARLLADRDEYEGELAQLCPRERLSCIACSALADGFLTGRYRRGRDLPKASEPNTST